MGQVQKAVDGKLMYVRVIEGGAWIKAINALTGMEAATFLGIEIAVDYFDEGEYSRIEAMLMLPPDAARYIVDLIVEAVQNPPPTVNPPGRN